MDYATQKSSHPNQRASKWSASPLPELALGQTKIHPCRKKENQRSELAQSYSQKGACLFRSLRGDDAHHGGEADQRQGQYASPPQASLSLHWRDHAHHQCRNIYETLASFIHPALKLRMKVKLWLKRG